MKVRATLFTLFILSVGLPATVVPAPGTQPVGPLFAAADLVCSCSVSSVDIVVSDRSNDAVQEPRRVRVRADIQEVYKPNGAKGTIEIEAEDQLFWKGENALMFLKSSPSGAYVLVPNFLGLTPFTFPPQHSPGEGLGKLENALVEVLGHVVKDDQISAMRVLQGFESYAPGTVALLTVRSGSQDQETALTAIAALLRTKRLEDLERLKKYLDMHATEDQPIAILSIGSELAQLRDPKALPILEALTTSQVLSIKHGAMQAIREMKNPAAGPILIQRLDDPDSYVRYLAVITLAETFDKYGDYAPNMALFDSNPAFYTNLWKKWWTEERSQ